MGHLHRSSRLSVDQILKRLDRERGSDKEMQQRIVAMVLHYKRGWPVERVAKYFEWAPDEVSKWLDAGKFHRAFGPKTEESK